MGKLDQCSLTRIIPSDLLYGIVLPLIRMLIAADRRSYHHGSTVTLSIIVHEGIELSEKNHQKFLSTYATSNASFFHERRIEKPRLDASVAT